MDNKKRNVQVESDGSRSALVPLWQELPHTLPEKAVKLIDSEGSV